VHFGKSKLMHFCNS